jgi:hypothetical protein
MKLRWDRIQVGDWVDMAPQGHLLVISREYDARSGLWILGFVHAGWRRVWRLGYIGWHEEEVVRPAKGTGRRAVEAEVELWMQWGLALRDLLRDQSRALYEAARARDRLLSLRVGRCSFIGAVPDGRLR